MSTPMANRLPGTIPKVTISMGVSWQSLGPPNEAGRNGLPSPLGLFITSRRLTSIDQTIKSMLGKLEEVAPNGSPLNKEYWLAV